MGWLLMFFGFQLMTSILTVMSKYNVLLWKLWNCTTLTENAHITSYDLPVTNHSCSLPVSWVPIISDIVGLGLTLLCLCFATSLSLVTIAIAWIAHRPLLGLTLLVAAAIPILLSKERAQRVGHRKSWTEIVRAYHTLKKPVCLSSFQGQGKHSLNLHWLVSSAVQCSLVLIPFYSDYINIKKKLKHVHPYFGVPTNARYLKGKYYSSEKY